MKPRGIVLTCLAASLLAGPIVGPLAAPAGERPPNILFVFADQWRADALG